MKKIYLLLLPLLCYASVCTAQEQDDDITGPSTIQKNHNLLSGLDPQNTGIGIKGGLNVASLYGSDKDRGGPMSALTGWHAGMFAQFALGNVVSLQPEVLYSRQGFERGDSTFRFDYINLPLLVVFNVTRHVSLHLGPQIGMLISAQQKGQEVDLEPYNTFDYGGAAGLEGRIGRIRLGVRYNVGLAELREEKDRSQPLNGELKNEVLQAYLGIGF